MKKPLLALLAFAILLASFDADARRRHRRRRHREPKVVAEKPLFERMGGRRSWDAVLADFVSRAAKDPATAKAFSSSGFASRFRSAVGDELCEQAHGPCKGPGPKARAALLEVAPDEDALAALGAHWLDALAGARVPEREKNELMALLGEIHDGEEEPAPGT